MIEQNESSERKSALVAEIGATVMRWQDATQKFDELVGELYGLNAAERHCLSFLWSGPQAASAIAREIRLTPAAVTALIDRLEKRGYVTRSPDPQDRRKVRIEATEQTGAMVAEMYKPLGDAGAAMLARYTLKELETVARVLVEALAVQDETTERLAARLGKDG